MAVRVESPNVTYTDDYIESTYVYSTVDVTEAAGKPSNVVNGGPHKASSRSAQQQTAYVAVPRQTTYTFRTERRVPRVGVMLVGWGGNNGSTVTAMTLANRMRLRWPTKDGELEANYFGSITQSSTILLGYDSSDESAVHVPLDSILPMVNPNDIVLDGTYLCTL
jgi:myo-inositol-1-phosphate synthase